MTFEGKVALVTGGGQGLGRVIAESLAAAGCEVLVAGRNSDALDAVVRAIEARGGRASGVSVDLSQIASRAMLQQAIDQRHQGQIDILVANAGMRDRGGNAVANVDPEDFDRIFAVNLRGVVLSAQAVLPSMQRRRAGKIVAIGGQSARRGTPNRSAGSASKWALRGLVRSLALEVGRSNINVNMVSPGLVSGPRADELVALEMKRTGDSEAAILARRSGDTALGRLSSPEDVAAAVLFLCSDAAQNITGQDLRVDGGAYL